MADDLTLYTNPQSRGRIARWMLEEVGAPYDMVILDYASTMKGDDYRAINPMGKVPAIRHGRHVVTETAAICAYLAEAFPESGLAPTADERADYYRWMFFSAGPLEQAVTDTYMGLEPDPDQQRMAGYGTLAQAVDALDAALSKQPFIAGERFTAADVYVGASVGWYTQFGLVEKRPAFVNYLSRVQVRPAFVRAGEKDNAAIAAA